MFGATGNKTKAPLYELSYKHILKDFLNKRLKEMIFEISLEYIDYELSENSFGSIKSMTQIFEVRMKTTNYEASFYSYKRI